MSKLENIRLGISKYYPIFFLPLILIYLSFNIFDGNNGLLSHPRLDTQIAVLEGKIENVKNSNNLYEIKISSLQSLDKNNDLLDQEIRKVLGYGQENEYIIYFDN